jgi:hypothetical protein
VAVMMMMQEYIQLPQQSIRAYANRVKANWRQAEWNLKKHDEVLYEIAWVGLRNTVMNKGGPMTAACGRFDSLDEFFDQTAASQVTHVEPKKPHQQQKQQLQQRQKQPTDWSSKGDERSYQPCISEPADTTSGGNSGQSGSYRHSKSGSAGQLSGVPPAP